MCQLAMRRVFLDIQEELLLRIMDIVEASGTAVACHLGPLPVAKSLSIHGLGIRSPRKICKRPTG